VKRNRNLNDDKNISYLGLGTMGGGMVSQSSESRLQAHCLESQRKKCGPFGKKGARIADTPADAVRDAELVMYCLSNDQAVEEVGL